MSRTLLRLLLRLPKEQYKDVTAENFTVKPRFYPIRPVGGGWGGGGGGGGLAESACADFER